MSLTVTIEDANAKKAEALARTSGQTAGELVNEILSDALAQRLQSGKVPRELIPVFKVPDGTPAISAERVRELLDECP